MHVLHARIRLDGKTASVESDALSHKHHSRQFARTPSWAQLDDHKGGRVCGSLANRGDETQPGFGQLFRAQHLDSDVARRAEPIALYASHAFYRRPYIAWFVLQIDAVLPAFQERRQLRFGTRPPYHVERYIRVIRSVLVEHVARFDDRQQHCHLVLIRHHVEVQTVASLCSQRTHDGRDVIQRYDWCVGFVGDVHDAKAVVEYNTSADVTAIRADLFQGRPQRIGVIIHADDNAIRAGLLFLSAAVAVVAVVAAVAASSISANVGIVRLTSLRNEPDLCGHLTLLHTIVPVITIITK